MEAIETGSKFSSSSEHGPSPSEEVPNILPPGLTSQRSHHSATTLKTKAPTYKTLGDILKSHPGHSNPLLTPKVVSTSVLGQFNPSMYEAQSHGAIRPEANRLGVASAIYGGTCDRSMVLGSSKTGWIPTISVKKKGVFRG